MSVSIISATMVTITRSLSGIYDMKFIRLTGRQHKTEQQRHEERKKLNKAKQKQE